MNSGLSLDVSWILKHSCISIVISPLYIFVGEVWELQTLAHGEGELSQEGENEIVKPKKESILERRHQVCRKGYASCCTV